MMMCTATGRLDRSLVRQSQDSVSQISASQDSAGPVTLSRALVGQLHSRIVDAGGANITYMTPIESIFQDIQQATPGARVKISAYSPS
ncbi:MAG: hypothetical protein Q9181_007279 [Wetmoreana brouardii]